MVVSTTTKPVRPDEVMNFPAGESVCLHHPDTGSYYTLNAVAAFVWDLCDGALTVEQIADKLTQAFKVDKATALTDLQEWLAFMHSEQCITLTGD